jgi:hypothetical protein
VIHGVEEVQDLCHPYLQKKGRAKPNISLAQFIFFFFFQRSKVF